MDSRKLVVLLESPLHSVHSAELVRGAINAGLRWPTPYWPELAVRWLEQGAPLDAEMAKLLDAVVAASHFPQNLRHRAFALACRFEKSDSGA